MNGSRNLRMASAGRVGVILELAVSRVVKTEDGSLDLRLARLASDQKFIGQDRARKARRLAQFHHRPDKCRKIGLRGL